MPCVLPSRPGCFRLELSCFSFWVLSPSCSQASKPIPSRPKTIPNPTATIRCYWERALCGVLCHSSSFAPQRGSATLSCVWEEKSRGSCTRLDWTLRGVSRFPLPRQIHRPLASRPASGILGHMSALSSFKIILVMSHPISLLPGFGRPPVAKTQFAETGSGRFRGVGTDACAAWSFLSSLCPASKSATNVARGNSDFSHQTSLHLAVWHKLLRVAMPVASPGEGDMLQCA